MAKSFDVSKFRKDLTKSISGMSAGFNDPTDWISTGSYALNYLVSGDFHKGVPLGKVTVFVRTRKDSSAISDVKVTWQCSMLMHTKRVPWTEMAAGTQTSEE